MKKNISLDVAHFIFFLKMTKSLQITNFLCFFHLWKKKNCKDVKSCDPKKKKKTKTLTENNVFKKINYLYSLNGNHLYKDETKKDNHP
jgi:hypothetical protein